MNNREPKSLVALPDEDFAEAPAETAAAAGSGGSELILERNGVHYINGSAFTPDQGVTENLDPNFRDLVNSVINN
jgi:hypothetical protein